jgi:hypothetical protein
MEDEPDPKATAEWLSLCNLKLRSDRFHGRHVEAQRGAIRED